MSNFPAWSSRESCNILIILEYEYIMRRLEGRRTEAKMNALWPDVGTDKLGRIRLVLNRMRVN